MIKLVFGVGSAIREIRIKDDKVMMISNETNFTPVMLDKEKIRKLKNVRGLKRSDKQLINEVKKLNTEEEMAQDIINDFKKTGWALVKKEVLNGND